MSWQAGAGLACLVCLSLIGQTAEAAPHARARLVADRVSVAPGERFRAALVLDIEEGWHVYWRNPGDSGLPPTMEWDAPGPDASGFYAGAFSWPIPHEQPLGGLMNYGYEDQLVLPFSVRAGPEAGAIVMAGEASWLICKDVCIPESAHLSLALAENGANITVQTDGKALIDAALASVPGALRGTARFSDDGETLALRIADPLLAEAARGARRIRFFPDGHEITHAATQIAMYGPRGIGLDVRRSAYMPEPLSSLSGVVVVESVAGDRIGVRLRAEKGVAPAGVSEHVLVSVQPRSDGVGIVGIVTFLVLAFLGGLILNLMPCVLPVLAIKATGLAAAAQRGGLAAHGLGWLAGVVSCFVLTGAVLLIVRSFGEQVGLGFQLQFAPLTAGLSLLMFVIGLNLLGVFEIGTLTSKHAEALAEKNGAVGAYFTGFLAALVGAPCVGPLMAAAMASVLTQNAWLVIAVFASMGVGMALPLTALSFMPRLADRVPKSGAWMVQFRQFLAFPMFFSALWLVWVVAGQAGTDGVLAVVLAAILIAFGFWVLRLKMRGASVAGVLFLALGLIAGVAGSSGQSAPQSREAEVLEWSPEKRDALRAAGTPFFVDFTARWCITCQINKTTTLNTPSVRTALAENGVVFLVADWTNRDPLIAEELRAHGRIGVPLYLLYPKGGGPPHILPQILTPALVVDSIEEAVNSTR